jgi:predicted AlkP superfamily phosphohydrolase/phosphomutase
MTDGRKLVVIGLDAGDRAFIAEHADKLPNISDLLARGRGGPLEAEPMSGAVWASFVTRTRPDEHGMFHLHQWDPQSMRIRRPGLGWVPIRPFWRDLGERGVRVVAFDVPFVFPGPSRNVVEVANWGSHDLVGPFWSTDPALAKQVRRKYGLHPMGFEVPVQKTAAHLRRILDQVVAGCAVRARLVVDLMRAQSWDVFLVAFGETHRAGHVLWPDPDDPRDPAPADAMLQVYEAVDEAVGAVVREAGPEADVVLFALHGMGPNSSQSHLTSIFMQRALAYFRGRPAAAEAGEAPGFIRALRREIPAGLQHAIAERVPQWVRDAVIAREISGGYRWEATEGFALSGDLAGYLRLNIKGREARGALPAEEAPALRAFLRDELLALTLPDGRPVVRAVSFPAAEGTGARSHLLPDVVVQWDPDLPQASEVRSPHLGTIRAGSGTGRGGNHRFNGFYVHRGPRQAVAATPRHIAELGDLIESLV